MSGHNPSDARMTAPASYESLTEALRWIARHGCENYVKPHECRKDLTRSRSAQYAADGWCDACVAMDALSAYLKSATEPKQCQPDAYVEGERRTIAALEAAIAALSGGGWLPIESAPKDGTPILVLLSEPMLGSLMHVAVLHNNVSTVASIFAFDAPPMVSWQSLPATHAQAGEGSNG